MTQQERAALDALRARVKRARLKMTIDLAEFTDGEGNPLPLLEVIEVVNVMLDGLGEPRVTIH